MKNITLALDEHVLAAVRKYAALRNTTVNALVRDYLTRLAAQEDRQAEARKKLVELSERATFDLGDWTWNREELYDRGKFPRHEHSDLRGFAESGGEKEEKKSD